MWFDSNLRRESRRRDRLRKAFLRTKTVSAEKQYKQQRNRVNNLKKQAKELFYANINENLDELKTADSKMYWKTIHMLLKNKVLRILCHLLEIVIIILIYLTIVSKKLVY